MEKFVVNVLIKVLSNPDVWVQIEKLIGNIIAKQILPVVPVAIGAAVKAGVDDIIQHIPGVSGVVDIAKTTEGAVTSIEQIVGNIPVIGDILTGWIPK